MKRRQLVTGLGALIGGSSILMGSGAFTSVEGDRDVSVQVANEDAGAYLKIARSPDSPFVNPTSPNSGKRLQLDFNNEIRDRDSKGPGQSSEYEFDDVFRITNQGTQTVYVNISNVTTHNGATTVRFYVRDESNNRVFITPGSNDLESSTGTENNIGVYIDTGDESNYSTSNGDGHSSAGNATITANANSDDPVVSP